MGNFILCSIIFRIGLPLVFLTCIVFRPCILSAVYLLLLLLSASVPVPSVASLSGSTGVYLKVIIVASTLTTFGQIIFQTLLLLKFKPYGGVLEDCGFLERLLRHAGFIKLDRLDVLPVFVWVTPELVMFVASVAFYVVFSKLTKPAPLQGQEEGLLIDDDSRQKKQHNKLLVSLGKYLAIAALCVTAILKPSVPGGFYFLVFLSAATWWACCLNLQKGFAVFMKFCMLIVFCHIFTYYAYQTDWPQEYLPANSTYARYFGFTPLMTTDCIDPRIFDYQSKPWTDYAVFLSLIVLYFILAIESKHLLQPQDNSPRQSCDTGSPGEETPLIHSVSSTTQKYGVNVKGPAILQDSTGSVIVANENADDIPLKQVPERKSMANVSSDDDQATWFEQMLYVLESILLFIIKTSYIATNIIMMTWSITYHSWLTFVLLLWASMLWMVPNQRKFMLRSSPFLVIYAWFLLISAYIYSMDLTEAELPTKVDGIDLTQIGFIRVTAFPCNQLFVKSLYTIMFWITLKQFVKERRDARQNSALADMVAPLQISVGAATGVNKDQERGNKLLENVGNFVRRLLTKFWIWIVAITLFLVAITGQRMTCFRILYMALFLFFILSFLFSFRGWRKIMFGFWLTVIIYSMIILVLVYTYQFNNFPEYWKTYLHVSEQQQLDIGLEKYETKQLFVRLVTPTFFVIITVVQLHYFHKDFLEISKPAQSGVLDSTKSEANSSAQGGVQIDSEEEENEDKESVMLDLTDIDNVSTKIVRRKLGIFLHKLYDYVNLLLVYLELHMPKLVLLVSMVVCVMDVAAIYIVVVILLVFGAAIGKWMLVRIAVNICALIAALLLLARMIYQTQYIEHDIWNVTCPAETDNVTMNDAEWLGLSKVLNGRDLPGLVKWNIIQILAVTVWCIINVRQSNFRASHGDPIDRPYFMFPKIKVTNADKSLINYFKYLANYCFYRLGVEICLIAIVATIGLRMDLYALLYGVWLCVLFPMKRDTLTRWWNVFLVFIAVVIPLQYFMVIGLPPSLCISFPWSSSDFLRRLQEWAFLMDSKIPPPPKKILCDFGLLILVARQSLVFRIEKRHAAQNYPGGSNESIIHQAEEKDFVIPVPDYITYSRNYLDIFKKTTLMPFMWVTLAIVFLAGTNRVNLFSIGYLIGSFYFLWQGSDIYLLPIQKILTQWNGLLGYNVVVIISKCVLQLIGCLFFDYINKDACWLAQLLGISCLRKFKVVAPINPLDKNECVVPREYVGLAWDGACFAFLLLQRRLFQSYNFFHIINETKASAILASRGADLIEELQQKRMIEQEEAERKIIEKIKMKMDRIKANQQKILGPNYENSENHYADTIFPKSNRPMYRRKEPKSYKAAIRSGDYYMFDDVADDELDVFEDVDSKSDASDQKRDPRKRTLSEVHITRPKEPEPRASTSKSPDEDDKTLVGEPSKCQKVLDILLFLFAFLDSLMLSATNFVNRYSRDHRYVIRVLSMEKKILKETTEYNVGVRAGPKSIWQPSASYKNLLIQSRGQQVNFADECESGEMSSYDQPTVLRLLLAMWYLVLSHSDILCYFLIFLNQTRNATFLSLPLPLMVFFWGTLTIPRPSKTFWITIIAYTQIIVLIKCMFQFHILPWNSGDYTNYPNATSIIGIEKKKDYAVWDLLLLLVVYFHRFMLKCLGLWKSSYEPIAVLSEGEYTIENGELKPKTEHTKPRDSRRSSDLEQLVDESDNEDKIYLHSGQVDPKDMFPSSIKMTLEKYSEGMKEFFRQLFDPTSRVAANVYSFMFLCDFFNFFAILMDYSSFGSQQGDEGVSSYLEDNRVPVLFLFMLILQFLIIIIDRAIFLRKHICAKIIFQFFQIMLLHIWLFILFPIITERSVNSVVTPQMYYMVKCFYLLLSAYQIRCGYPTRILGNFLCKGYNYLNMFLFKGFMLIPFLFELRTVMDWVWTDTSMTVFDWIKMEDIFAHIYQLKCTRYIESEYPQPRGEKKKPLVKYFMGGGLLALIIGIIWFPLVFFSLGNAVGEANPPYDVTIDLSLGPYEPLYRMTAQSNSIFTFTETDYTVLQQRYLKDKVGSTFISNYDFNDVAAVKLSTDSATVWSISPPDKQRMIEEVESPNTVTVRLQYQVSHQTNTKEDPGVMRDEVELKIDAVVNNKTNPIRQALLDMLKQTAPTPTPLHLNYLLPKFVKVTSRGKTQVITQLMEPYPDVKSESARNISLVLSDQEGRVWWNIKEECDDYNYNTFLKFLPYSDCESIMMYTFNDKIFPATLNIITGGGIIGLYTTLVFVASRVLRGFFSEICFKIMFDDMPCVDRVLQLCLDIYLVREAGEFSLEEDLFAKLVFLYRSPETLIKWTRPIEEPGDEDDPEGDANN